MKKSQIEWELYAEKREKVETKLQQAVQATLVARVCLLFIHVSIILFSFFSSLLMLWALS